MSLERTSWMAELDNKTPFRSLAEYDRIVGEQCRENKTWRLVAIISAAGFFVSLGITAFALSLPKTVPLVITVSDFGEAKYLGDVSKYSYAGIKVPDIAIQYQLRRFVTNLYTMPTDAEVLKANLKECYASLTPQSAGQLSARLRENNPYEEFGNVVARVEIESVLALAGSSWQVDFIVTKSSPNGMTPTRKRMRGTLTTSLMEPAPEDLLLNPLGIYIIGFDFTTIGDVK